MNRRRPGEPVIRSRSAVPGRVSRHYLTGDKQSVSLPGTDRVTGGIVLIPVVRDVSVCLFGSAILLACTASFGDSDMSGMNSPDAGSPPPDSNQSPVIDLPFVPSNILAEHVVAGQARLDLSNPDGVIEIDTDTGAILSNGSDVRPQGVAFVKVAQTGKAGLPDLGVFSATDLVITSGTRVHVRGAAGLVLALSGSASIEGVLFAGGGFDNAPGPGGFRGGTGDDVDGAGPGGGKYGGLNDTGGGGGGHAAVGGNGGSRGNAPDGVDPGGPGGAVYGGPELVPLMGGSGGGRGGNTGGAGGGGGGAIQITALGSIQIAAGIIDVGGGGGRTSNDDDGGGGGGAGGAILLEAPTVQLAAGVLVANGGGGGSGGNDRQPGNSGEAGRADITAAAGGARAGEGAAGGNGGAGENLAGRPGQNSAGQENVDENAGGGGGACGRIYFRADVLQLASPVLSPGEVKNGGLQYPDDSVIRILESRSRQE